MNISFLSRRYVEYTNSMYSSNNKISKNNKKPDNVNKNVMLKNIASKSLGKMSNKNGILKSLMEQKSNLLERKNSIMEEALKVGKDPKDIKEKIAEINKQIEAIDKEISKIQLEEQRKALGTGVTKGKKGEKSKQQSNKTSPKDSQVEPSLEDLNNVLRLSTNISGAKELFSIKNSISQEAAILKGEIKIDRSRAINPVNSASKMRRINIIENSIESINEKMNTYLSDVNNKYKNSIKDNTSIDVIVKNEQEKDTKSIKNRKVKGKTLRSQMIKNYVDNNKTDYSGNKVNVMI